MKIAVIGTGYVGLTTGACLAEMGHSVTCVDIDSTKIENLAKGVVPIYEPGLEGLVSKNTKRGRLHFSTNTADAIHSSEIVISAVGTPQGKDQKADLQFVKEVAREFGRHINEYKVFINKSTVPVGTGDLCKKIIQEELDKRGEDVEFTAVSNPEFLKEGSAIFDTLNPDRIIVGHENGKAKEIMSKLYKPLSDQGCEIIFTDLKTAEIIKYASNAMLATRISFMNEIASFCEKAGGDIKTIAKGIGLDKRIGKHFLNAGIGYGGSCFPKDVRALIEAGKEVDHEFKIIKAVEEVNEAQKESIFRKLQHLLGPLEGKTIAIWGLAFKPNTDDMRSAPSLTTIQQLQVVGASIRAYDPSATEQARKTIEPLRITYCDSAYKATENADALLILTEWEEFKAADLEKVKANLKTPLILDGRNIFEKETLENLGFTYMGVGTSTQKKRE